VAKPQVMPSMVRIARSLFRTSDCQL